MRFGLETVPRPSVALVGTGNGGHLATGLVTQRATVGALADWKGGQGVARESEVRSAQERGAEWRCA